MKVFLDSANLVDVADCLNLGFISGITTNPSILAKEPKANFVEHIKKIVALMQKNEKQIPLSVEVFTADPKKMLDQALMLVDQIQYENINIKVPIGWGELGVISELSKRGIKVNCTCLFNESQSILAENAGAHYLSIFYGRLKDIGGDPIKVIQNVRATLDRQKSDSEIIVGSIRQEQDVADSSFAGAHIATFGRTIMTKMVEHPQTKRSVDGFLKDFSEWLS